jgi:DMSO/TMAO reductase YedYZ molybdopterin-dependent catalytic subunit
MKRPLHPGLISRQTDPANLESLFSTLDGRITQNESFYVRSHFAVPEIDPRSWRLRVEGAVAHPRSLSLDDIIKMPSATYAGMLECAGNGRAFLSPKHEGVQWELGAVGCARWTGVPLAAILEEAGLNADAAEIILEAADKGVAEKTSRPAAPIHFERSIPVADVRRRDVLLAYAMNGEPLPKAHGAPLRAIVPGWYAMASVKWLTRILVSRQAFRGYFQTVDYAYWSAPNGMQPERVPLSELAVKSQIARPAMKEAVPAGSIYRVHGTAWSSMAEIRKVEVTTNGGESWQEAHLLDAPLEHAWQRWEYLWNVPGARGSCTLMSRATDARGCVQPVAHDRNYEGYVIHHTIPVSVQIA